MTEPHRCAGPRCETMLEGRRRYCSNRCQQAARRAADDLLELDELGAPVELLQRIFDGPAPPKTPRARTGGRRAKVPPAMPKVPRQGVNWRELPGGALDFGPDARPYRGITNKSGLPWSGAKCTPPARRLNP